MSAHDLDTEYRALVDELCRAADVDEEPIDALLNELLDEAGEA